MKKKKAPKWPAKYTPGNFNVKVKRSVAGLGLFAMDEIPRGACIIEYKGNRLKGNLVEMYTNGGLFPIWTPCLYVSSDVADSLYD